VTSGMSTTLTIAVATPATSVFARINNSPQIGLAIGGIVLDLGTQANLVTNQTRVHRLIPEARNRINTLFMVTYFVGGALGTFLAGFAWSLWQWTGVCALGASFFGAALIVWAVGSWESEGRVRRAERPEIRPVT